MHNLIPGKFYHTDFNFNITSIKNGIILHDPTEHVYIGDPFLLLSVIKVNIHSKKDEEDEPLDIIFDVQILTKTGFVGWCSLYSQYSFKPFSLLP